MKCIYLLLFMSSVVFANNISEIAPKYSASHIPQKMSVATKKKRFYSLLVPSVTKVHNEVFAEYQAVKKDLKSGSNATRTARLKKKYNVKSDASLLRALKPHPISITLAQAAMESAWGTSRFFVKANNVFGVWSTNKNQARIAASQKRNGTRTIWLRKFASIEDAIRDYYRMMGKAKAYKDFRLVRYQTNDVYKIVKKLDKYSEIGEKYTKELANMIRYNKLTQYDK